jgi:hypothetical protein
MLSAIRARDPCRLKRWAAKCNAQSYLTKCDGRAKSALLRVHRGRSKVYASALPNTSESPDVFDLWAFVTNQRISHDSRPTRLFAITGVYERLEVTPPPPLT